jgi:chemotaxis signal transduction protein
MVAEEAAEHGRLLAFKVGRGRFGVALERVLAVLDPAEAAPMVARGAAVFRGAAVPVLDARRLGWGGDAGQGALSPPALVIVGRPGAPGAALAVDGIEGMLDAVGMLGLPALVAPFVHGVFRGVVPQPDGWLLVIDPDALAGRAGKATGADGRGGSGEA